MDRWTFVSCPRNKTSRRQLTSILLKNLCRRRVAASLCTPGSFLRRSHINQCFFLLLSLSFFFNWTLFSFVNPCRQGTHLAVLTVEACLDQSDVISSCVPPHPPPPTPYLLPLQDEWQGFLKCTIIRLFSAAYGRANPPGTRVQQHSSITLIRMHHGSYK